MSRCLAERGIDHVVLERGLIANSWRTERWDSLRLLTPNWQSRLPGYDYEGNDPDGYRTMPEVVAFIDRYAEVIAAPVELQTTVTSVRQSDTALWSRPRGAPGNAGPSCWQAAPATFLLFRSWLKLCRQRSARHLLWLPQSGATARGRRLGGRRLGDGDSAR